MRSGVCYYPEHWPQKQWARVARWLRELGISIVRMAEFAWSRPEPAESRFDFGLLDEAVELFAAQGLDVVLGTPTAAQPLWLSSTDPSMLPVAEQGRRRRPGGRHHVCPTSPAFRAHARRIVAAMADRYAQHEAVFGWQIDNESPGPLWLARKAQRRVGHGVLVGRDGQLVRRSSRPSCSATRPTPRGCSTTGASSRARGPRSHARRPTCRASACPKGLGHEHAGGP